jgi:hypothetical protein
MKRDQTRERHGDILAKLQKLAGTAFCKYIEQRRSVFDVFVCKVAKTYGIEDRKILAKAIDFATRRYYGKDPLPKQEASALFEAMGIEDKKAIAIASVFAARWHHTDDPLSEAEISALLKAIPKIAPVLLRAGNDKRIADLLVQREDALIRGGQYDPCVHGEAIASVTRTGLFLLHLERHLKVSSRGGRRPNVRLHSAVLFLEDYWRALPGKRLRRNFTNKDTRTGRPLAKSEAMRFIEEVVQFIDPGAVAKLENVTQHRLRGVGKIAPKSGPLLPSKKKSFG